MGKLTVEEIASLLPCCEVDKADLRERGYTDAQIERMNDWPGKRK